MPDLIPFVATLRCIINSESEVDAEITADRLQILCLEYLDEEDGDRVIVTQVTSHASDLAPEEQLVLLRRARNTLIRTRLKECFDTARELDKTIYSLEHSDEAGYELGGYDYGRLLDIAEMILKQGKDPVT